MERHGKGKGVGFLFKRGKSSSPKTNDESSGDPSKTQLADEPDLSPDLSGYVTYMPSAPKPKSPSPTMKFWKFMKATSSKSTRTPRQSVRPGTTIKIEVPNELPQHASSDENDDPEEEDEEEEEEEEPAENPIENEADDDGPDESEPMTVDHDERSSRAQKPIGQLKPNYPYKKEPKPYEPQLDYYGAVHGFSSEEEMMKAALRRSRMESYAPPLPPLVAPTYYPSPPSPYQPYPMYPPYAPYPHFPQYPVYPPYYEPPRSSYSGSSSFDYACDPTRRLSGSHIDPLELAEIRSRTQSMERERDWYKEQLEKAEKSRKK